MRRIAIVAAIALFGLTVGVLARAAAPISSVSAYPASPLGEDGGARPLATTSVSVTPQPPASEAAPSDPTMFHPLNPADLPPPVGSKDSADKDITCKGAEPCGP